MRNTCEKGGVSRRDFVKMAAGVVALGMTGAGCAATQGSMPYRPLGKTGETISAIGVGGYHIGIPKDEQTGIAIVRTAIDRGINFMDNCWDYMDGRCETIMGKALRDGYRNKVFLMTKIDSRSRKNAVKQMDESLQRLQTDHVDLLQFHEIIRMGDPDLVFAEDGPLEAVQEAKKAGKIRFIGFTGHKDPDIHLRMLEVAAKHNFRFDAVQMPLNVMDAHFHSFRDKVVPVLVRDGIGILGMKPLGSGAIMRSNTVTAIECLHYAMTLPTSTVITGMDSLAILDQSLEAARTFRPMNPQTLAALLEKTAAAAATGQYEQFKTGTDFDGTSRNPNWTA